MDDDRTNLSFVTSIFLNGNQVMVATVKFSKSSLFVEETSVPQNNTDLPQLTEMIYQIMLQRVHMYRHERYPNSQC